MQEVKYKNKEAEYLIKNCDLENLLVIAFYKKVGDCFIEPLSSILYPDLYISNKAEIKEFVQYLLNSNYDYNFQSLMGIDKKSLKSNKIQILKQWSKEKAKRINICVKFKTGFLSFKDDVGKTILFDFIEILDSLPLREFYSNYKNNLYNLCLDISFVELKK